MIEGLEGIDLPTPCVVSWIDAYASEFEDPRDLESEKSLIVHSCGWLIGGNEWGLVLSTDYYPIPFEGEEFRGYSFIPTKMVKHIHICSGGLDI